MSRLRSEVSHNHRVEGLITLVAMVLLLVPSAAPADLVDDIAAAFDEFVNGLDGSEIEDVYVEGDQPCIPGWRHWKATVVGFAFCSPPDPFADPVSVPVPPHNIYGCTDAATFDVDVAPDETTADVVTTIDPLYLDLEFEREEGLCYPAEGWGPNPLNYSDGYLLMDATLALTLELEDEGGCIRASIVPGSVDVTLGEQTKELGIQGDDCLATFAAALEPVLWELILPQMETALEVLIESLMVDISDQLCELTPVSSSTWGALPVQREPGPHGPGSLHQGSMPTAQSRTSRNSFLKR